MMPIQGNALLGGVLQQGPGGGSMFPTVAGAGADASIVFVLRVEGRVPLSPKERLRAEFSGALPVLQPGEPYRIVMAPESRRREGAAGVSVHPGSRFYLIFQGWEGVVIDIPEYILADTSLESLRHAFTLTVPEDCPADEGSFVLAYAPDDFSSLELLTDVKVRLGGSFGPQDEKFLDEVFVQGQPPSQVAIVRIWTAPTEGLTVRGGATDREGRWRPLEPCTIGTPQGEIAALMQEQTDPKRIAQLMDEFSSRETEPLQRWLAPLLSEFPDGELRLLICDYTYSQMPWEMLKVELPGDREGYLGAHACVSRWLPVRHLAKVSRIDWGADPLEGGALVFLDSPELAYVSDEQEAVGELALTSFGTLEALLDAIEKQLAGTGLVYLASHGTFTSGDELRTLIENQISVGSLVNPSGRLSLLDVARFPSYSGARPALFVNACHSARVFRSDTGSPIGLPRALLARVAALYIGTLGPVNSAFASRLAGRFLRAAGTGGVSPAEFLREERLKATESVRRKDTLASWVDLIYAFLYVVYGNPLACLRIRGGGEGADEGDAHE
jgi:hypothetical protein